MLRVGLIFGIREKFEPDQNATDRALMEGLRARGYELGRNYVFEFRSAAGFPERLPALAAETPRSERRWSVCITRRQAAAHP